MSFNKEKYFPVISDLYSKFQLEEKQFEKEHKMAMPITFAEFCKISLHDDQRKSILRFLELIENFKDEDSAVTELTEAIIDIKLVLQKFFQ